MQDTIQDQRLANIETELGIKYGLENNSKRINDLAAEIKFLISKIEDLNENLSVMADGFHKLEKRIATHEEARKRQIALNDTFATKSSPVKYALSQPEPSTRKSLWEQMKDRIKPL